LIPGRARRRAGSGRRLRELVEQLASDRDGQARLAHVSDPGDGDQLPGASEKTATNASPSVWSTSPWWATIAPPTISWWALIASIQLAWPRRRAS
jgi:hypothetical protein